VRFSLRIEQEAAKIVAAMSDAAHDLFVLAMLDLPRDPHGLGRETSVDGARTTRAFALGSLGLIVYVVDDAMSTVDVVDVIWIG